MAYDAAMRYDQKPVHRKLIVPWHDTETTCLLIIVFMLAVFLFAIAGISVAGESVAHRDKIWLPILLLILSASVIISTAVRLVKRFRYRHSDHL